MLAINIVDVLWSFKFRKVPYDGIQGIKWNSINHLLRVSFSSGEEIRYIYAATGVKLSEEFVDDDGTTLRRRDIYGSLEFLDGAFDRRQVDGGYIDRNSALHVYVNDYQGNVLAVLDCATGLAEQFSDYYPYGLPHPTEYAPETNRRRFGGKEYTPEFGFNVCDFGARLHDTLLSSFLSPDPKAADYPHISPYAYCAADPVNLVDPTGEVIIFVNGFIGGGSPPAGEDYWNGKNSEFVSGASSYFNDTNCVFLPINYKWYDSASKRFNMGYKYAQDNIIKLISPQERSIKFVSHSMEAAFVEGMAKYFLEQSLDVISIVHINAFQAKYINTSFYKSDNIMRIDYQNYDDPVINNLKVLGPGDIPNCNYVVREITNEKNILYKHRSPIDKLGFDFWKTLNNKLSQPQDKFELKFIFDLN